VPRRPYHHGDLRNALLARALQLIEAHGPDAVSLREVARAVGVNHRAAYRHFEDKRALTAAIAEAGSTALAEALERSWAATAGRPPRARLSALLDRYAALALEHPARYRVTFGRRVNEDGRFPALEGLAERCFAVLAGAVAALGPGRGPAATRDLVFSLWSLAHGYLRLVWAGRIRVRPALQRRYLAALAAPLLDGWERGPPRKALRRPRRPR
jgi:AcrR family transcriptional regulator